MRLSVVILIPEPCRREIRRFPIGIRGDLADALARLDAGLRLAVPLSRPMPNIGKGVHELRLKERSGAYRIVYAVVRSGIVDVLHTFKKTTQATSKRDLDIAKRRLKELTL